MLKIENLSASVEGKTILQGFSLEVKPGEIHAIMGPNGAGKSTLAKVLGGHPSYEATGSALLNGEEILELDPEDRVKKGLFMSFQYPVEIPGVTNQQLLETMGDNLDEKMRLLKIDESFKTRNVNEGFSGGEKKRNEILQMAMLDPKVAILDETDSGLDIDALKIVADGINQLMNKDRGLILITHYQRLLDYIKPDYVHVMMDGKIVESGGPEIALKLEEGGYASVS